MSRSRKCSTSRKHEHFAIGDIHGYLKSLDALLDFAPLREAELVVFLGDYVDKGSDSRGVLDRLMEIRDSRHTVFLRGNHDQMLIDAHRDRSKLAIWETLAGPDSQASFGCEEISSVFSAVTLEQWAFLERDCRDFFETPEYIFVHGGIRVDRAPSEEDVERLQWTTLGCAEAHRSGRIVICGHSAQASGEIVDLGHTICIDSGITKGGWLSCLRLDDFSYWQASADGECRSGRLVRETAC